MNSKFVRAALAALVLAGLCGCAHYPANAPKTADSTEGYYYHNHQRTNNSEDILMLLAFSGGGTRASAFSYGLLETLRDTTFEVEGKKRAIAQLSGLIDNVKFYSIDLSFDQFSDESEAAYFLSLPTSSAKSAGTDSK